MAGRQYKRIAGLQDGSTEEWKNGRMAGWKFMYNGIMERPFSASVPACLFPTAPTRLIAEDVTMHVLVA